MNFSNFYEVHCRLCVLIRGLQNLDKLSERKVCKAAQPPKEAAKRQRFVATATRTMPPKGGERI